MNLIVESVPDGALLVDAYAPFTEADLDRLTAATWNGRTPVGCIRDLDTFTLDERDRILARGWGVMTYGTALNDSMAHPCATFGQRDGLRAVTKLRALEFPTGPTHGLDVEGPFRAPAEAVAEYVNAAWDVVRVQTELGLYRGWGINMTPAQLFEMLRVALYWKSAPKMPDTGTRGDALVQLVENITLAGVRVDLDEHKVDKLGGSFHWLRGTP